MTMAKSPAKFPVVGIGASAGGLEALEQFFGNMPSNSGMATGTAFAFGLQPAQPVRMHIHLPLYLKKYMKK
jgi:hypothetical protein